MDGENHVLVKETNPKQLALDGTYNHQPWLPITTLYYSNPLINNNLFNNFIREAVITNMFFFSNFSIPLKLSFQNKNPLILPVWWLGTFDNVPKPFGNLFLLQPFANTGSTPKDNVGIATTQITMARRIFCRTKKPTEPCGKTKKTILYIYIIYTYIISQPKEIPT